jgi:5-methylcytosine-specific restriction endonuclease McrA
VNKVTAVLVLNASLEPLHRVTLRHAVRMLVRQVAEVHEADGDRQVGPYPRPRVVRLVRYVVTRWQWTRAPGWSRARVLARDRHRCAYCGRTGTTIDHVRPQSRGGRSTWTNTVAACVTCNARKRDRTLAEAGMRLLFEPYQPQWLGILY